MKNLKIIIFLIFALVVFGLAGFFIYKDFKKAREPAPEFPANLNLSNSEQKKNENQTIGETKNKQQSTPAVVEKISAKVPDLSKPIEVKAELSEKTKKQALSEIKTLIETLKKDYNSFDAWIQLGLLRKLLGDYEGAREAWEFASFVRPESYIPFHNLGFLYWQYLKDFKKSEQNYLKAIGNEPKDIGAYEDLNNVYYFNLADKNKAEEILIKGLKANPENAVLLIALRELRAR